MPVAPPGTIGGWNSSYLTKFLNDWLRRNPLPAQDQLTIKKLAVSDSFATSSTANIGFFGATPVVRPSAAGTATGYTAGSTAATFHSDDKYSGNTGSTSYTINGIVAALKNLGLIAP